jgi:hypothetical protein
MIAPDQPFHHRAQNKAQLQAIVAWVGSQEHSTDCTCLSCAPISTPTRSPIVNDALAGVHGVEVAQGVALLVSLKPYGQKVGVAHLKALNGLQVKLR